jgi:hypothetical protein
MAKSKRGWVVILFEGMAMKVGALSFLTLVKVVYNIRNHNLKKDSTQLKCSCCLGALGMKNIWLF